MSVTSIRASVIAALTAMLVSLSSSWAGAQQAVQALRVGTQPGLGEHLVVPLLTDFLRKNGSMGVRVTRVDDANRTRMWRLATPPGEHFVPILGIVRESDDPFELVRLGAADIVVTASAPNPGVLAQFPGNWTAARAQRVLALQGIALIANPALKQLPVETKDVATLFATGQLAARAGAQARTVHFYVSNASAGAVGAAFQHLGMQVAAAKIASISFEEPDQVLNRVIGDPSGIGLLGTGGNFEAAASGAVSVVGIGDCGNAFQLMPETVLTEEYPLMGEVRLFLPEDSHYPPRVAQFISQFLSYATGSDAARIIREAGFATPTIQEYPPQSRYLTNKMSIMKELGADHSQWNSFQNFVGGASQLSRIIRFAYAESDLDDTARQELEIIAHWVIPLMNGKRQVLVAGFADGGGNDSMANIQLSRKRASIVAEYLRQHHNITIGKEDSQGFGQLGYFGCPQGRDGDRLSRRVEIWLR
jgi:outer membrane protein OmpA-like peptidoglycan-associated protein